MSLGLLYLFLVVLPNAGITVAVIGILLLVASLISFIAGAEAWDDEDKSPRYSWGRKLAFWAFVFILMSIPFPSENQLYKIAGGYVATNTKDVAKLPDNLVKAANAWLEKAADAAENKKSTSQK